MTKWEQNWYATGPFRTAAAGERVLGNAEGGVAERGERMADNAICALSRLVQLLHDKGVLTDSEVQHVLDMHGYEKVED